MIFINALYTCGYSENGCNKTAFTWNIWRKPRLCNGEAPAKHFLVVVIGFVQNKAWTDINTISIWYSKIYKPHIVNYSRNSDLLLDDFKCHKSHELCFTMRDDNAISFSIPEQYTGVLQLFDVSIIKSLKTRLKMLRLIGGVECILHYNQAKVCCVLSAKIFVIGWKNLRCLSVGNCQQFIYIMRFYCINGIDYSGKRNLNLI